MNYPLRITDIHAPTFPTSREADTIIAALNRLVRHAGQSLEHILIKVDKVNHWDIRPVSDQYRHFDLSKNTNLKTMTICASRVFRISEILSRVTSRCLSSVSINFKWLDWSDRGTFNDIFSQMDAVLSLPIFDNLVHVPIVMQCYNLDEEYAYRMKSCLAGLDIRGILGIKTCPEYWMPGVRLGLIWDYEIKDWRRFDSKTDEDGNVEIVEVPAFEGSAPPEAMAAYTAWQRTQRDNRYRSLSSWRWMMLTFGYVGQASLPTRVTWSCAGVGIGLM
ncbi:hypothetical protein IEO21_06453 [Rhodonia placenta]|uniref:Uncharacterized protein n=1 Tax=Rhodonia placenta TaxID=104341 RepID=A0A8H7P0A7_9APHY|nr:hypothetical protein IEO21_06453 [Postia placenta]